MYPKNVLFRKEKIDLNIRLQLRYNMLFVGTGNGISWRDLVLGKLTSDGSLSTNDERSLAGLSQFTDTRHELRCRSRYDYNHTADYYYYHSIHHKSQ
jgi:hypothetical protein